MCKEELGYLENNKYRLPIFFLSKYVIIDILVVTIRAFIWYLLGLQLMIIFMSITFWRSSYHLIFKMSENSEKL